MTEAELADLGSYKPGFLHLTVDTDLDFEDLNKIMVENKKEFSTFLHEYVHFLQNITTTTGLFQAVYYVRYVIYAIKQVYKSIDSFDIPVQVDGEEELTFLKTLHDLYRGQNKTVNRIMYRSYYSIAVNVKQNSKDENGININKYLIEYYDHDSRAIDTYELGSLAIKEFLANSIQTKFFDVDAPDILYKVVDLMISSEIPALENQLDMKIMMCEAALMTYQPAETLVKAIEGICTSGVIPNDPKAMYDFVLNCRNLNISAMFDDIYDNAISHYSELFQVSAFATEIGWITHILSEGKGLRINKPDFLLKIVSGSGEIMDDFKKVFNTLGTPFFTTNPMKGRFVPPFNLSVEPNQMYLLVAVASVVDVLFGSKNGCKLIDFCNEGEMMGRVDNLCRTEPWKKMEQGDLCPFCQLWKTWGIYEKEPKAKSNTP